MDYTITKAKRNYIIICAVYLIIHYLLISAYFFFDYYHNSLGLSIVGKILFGIAELSILGILIGYFKHIRQIVLTVLAILIFIIDLLSMLFDIIVLYIDITPVAMLASALYTVAYVGLFLLAILVVIFTLVNRGKLVGHTEVKAVRWFALGYIVAFIFSMLMSSTPSFIDRSGFIIYLTSFSYTPFLIPYIFIIRFALKAKLAKS